MCLTLKSSKYLKQVAKSFECVIENEYTKLRKPELL